MDVKDNTVRSPSKDQHEHRLVFAPITVALEWPPQKMNSNGKAANGPAGDSKQTNWPPCL